MSVKRAQSTNRIAILLTVVFVALAIPVFSQEFDGLKIDGWYFDFKPLLKARGFQPFSDDSLLFHRFSWSDGSLDREVNVFSTPKTRTVWKLQVRYRTHRGANDSASWVSIKSEYEAMREELVRKYGQPKTDIRTFVNPYDRCVNCEFYSTYIGKCNIMTIWNVTDGVVWENMEFGRVCVNYQNRANSILYNKEKPADWPAVEIIYFLSKASNTPQASHSRMALYPSSFAYYAIARQKYSVWNIQIPPSTSPPCPLSRRSARRL